MEKPRIEEVIVVEGRYDKNTLSQVVDAAIIELGGFAVFNDKQKLSLLRRLAKERGIILFTDPDGAGFLIRNRLKGEIAQGRVLQAYAPDIYGREKRKRSGGREGKLGCVRRCFWMRCAAPGRVSGARKAKAGESLSRRLT